MCVGAWFQCLFYFLGFDDVICLPPDDKFYKGGGVRDVLVIVPINDGVSLYIALSNRPPCPHSILIVGRWCSEPVAYARG